VLLANDLDFYPVDHTLMVQKENQCTERDYKVAEYVIVFFLAQYLESSDHGRRLWQLVCQVDEPVPEEMV
jgi:hypothetical protein